MPINYPASLDSLSNPGATTKRDETGFEHHLQHSNANDIIEALEGKLGIGATTPDAQFKSLVATAAGTSAWGYSQMVKLAEIAGTGASGVLEIASIPATFRTLEIHLIGRSDTAATSTGVRMTFETSPTSGAYNHEQLLASSTSVSSAENIGASDFITVAAVPAASSSANVMTAARILIPDYANTGIFKTTISTASEPTTIATASIFIRQMAGLFEATAAISRVRLTLSAGNWTTASRMTIYGIPG